MISTRISDQLLATVDGWAAANNVTRAAMLRAVLEDVLDSGELPDPPVKREEADELLLRLRELTRA